MWRLAVAYVGDMKAAAGWSHSRGSVHILAPYNEHQQGVGNKNVADRMRMVRDD